MTQKRSLPIQQNQKIVENSKDLKDALNKDLEENVKKGLYSKPFLTNAKSLVELTKNYKPGEELLVSGTNGGYLFYYKNELYSAISTERSMGDFEGETYIYEVKRITPMGVYLNYVNEEGRRVRKDKKYEFLGKTFAEKYNME